MPSYYGDAVHGDAESQYKMGVLFFKGNDVIKQDRSIAGAWFKKAADQGHLKAYYGLGKCYDFSSEMKFWSEKNRNLYLNSTGKDALAWYTKAADKGFAPAQYTLAQYLMAVTQCHLRTYEYIHMPLEARSLLIKAAEQGYIPAIGSLYCWFCDIEEKKYGDPVYAQYILSQLGKWQSEKGFDFDF